MKIKVTLLIIVIIIIIILSLVTREYIHVYTSDRVALSNLKLVSTGSCYIPLKITNRGKTQTIVCPNNILYYALHSENKMLFHSLYIYKTGKIIDKDRSLNVSDKIFNELHYYSVDSNLVNNYKNSEILKDTSIVKANYINYELGWETRKAIVYILLLRETNCCYNSEGGIVNIINNKSNP